MTRRPLGFCLALCTLVSVSDTAGAAPFDFLFGGPAPTSRLSRPRRRPARPPATAGIPLPPPRPHFPGDPLLPDVARETGTPPDQGQAKQPQPPATAPQLPPKPALPPEPIKPAATAEVPPETAETPSGSPGGSPPLPPVKPADIAAPAPSAAPGGGQPEPPGRAKATVPSTAVGAPPQGKGVPEPATPPLPPPKPADIEQPASPPPTAPAATRTPEKQPEAGKTAPEAASPAHPSSAAPPAPTPPPKPPEVVKPAVAPSGATTAFTPRSPADNPQCPSQLSARHVEATATTLGPQPDARCTVVEPVRLTGMTLADGAKVAFPDSPTVACTTADAFTAFVRDLLVPLAKGTFGSPVTAVWTGPGLECRSRDSIFGAKLSAHGQGLAIDIAQLKLADGRLIEVGTPKTEAETGFETAARAGACGYFHTVLGPGSDSYHRTHWHFDLELRGAHGDSKYCK